AAVLAAVLGLGLPALSRFQGGRAVILDDGGSWGGVRQAGMVPSPVFPPMPPPAQSADRQRRPFGELKQAVTRNPLTPPGVKGKPQSSATKVRKMEILEDFSPANSQPVPPLFLGGVKPAPGASWQQMSSQQLPSQQAPSQEMLPPSRK